MTKSKFDYLGKILFFIGITVAAIILFRYFCLEFAVLRWIVFIIYALIFPFVRWAFVQGKRLDGLESWFSFGVCQLIHYCAIGFLFGFDKYTALITEHYIGVTTGLILYHEICEFARKMCDATETDKDITSLIDEEKSTESHIVIRDGVEEIPSDVFKYNRKMTNITIPNTVKYIASEAFWGCDSLVEIVIPDSVKKIGSYAFGKCTSLKNIVIPASTKVDETAFEGSGMEIAKRNDERIAKEESNSI